MTPNIVQALIVALVFIAGAGVVLGLYAYFQRSRVAERLDTIIGPSGLPSDPRDQQREQWIQTFVKAATPLAKLSVPQDEWQTSELRRRFMQAGLRSEAAPTLFFGIKTALAAGLPLLYWLLTSAAGRLPSGNTLFLVLVLLAAIGMYAPNFVLRRITERRQREIFENFPDALDLLTICVEAGLSLDAAIARVAGEIRMKSEVLADELELVVLEMRAGGGKERALRNLAMRTGVDDVDTLVAMLIQSEKFGTSVGNALRIHSDMLRTKRQQRAEERAAKVAVKLLFPLILFIFPSILVVVGGPAMIRIAKSLPAMFGGS